MKDENERPISDAELDITATAGNITTSSPITTDEYGIAHFTYDADTGLEYGDSPLTVSLKLLVRKGARSSYSIYFLTVYPPDQDLATASINLLQSTVTTEDMKYDGVKAIVTISDQNGEAIKGATFHVDTTPSEINLVVEGNTITDESGRSIITIKAPGMDAAKDLIITITPVAENYSSGRTTAMLTVVYVQPSMELEINVSPESAKIGEEISITVAVTDSHTGKPVENASVALVASERNARFTEASGKTNSSGVFKTWLVISDIGKDSETVIITITVNLTGYEEVSDQKSIALSREKKTPDTSFIGMTGVLGIAALIAALRRKRL